MSYINFKATLKRANLKDDKKELVLEVTDTSLKNQLDALSEMVGCKLDVDLESEIIRFNVEINAATNEPTKMYKVSQDGVVEEMKPEVQQLELDGIPPEKIETTEEKKELKVDIIDDFIESGLAPKHDDLDYDFASLVQRKRAGEAYMKIATEWDISSGQIVELLDEYRKRVAPLAEKWDEWRKEQE